MRIRTLVRLGGLSLTAALLWRGLRWLASDDPRVCGLALALFRAQERRHPPPAHPVVFTGSSSIALWSTLAQDMADLTVLNRGIAGAKFPHIIHHAEALVTRYRPCAVVVFAGTNDISWPAPKPPEVILTCFQTFVARVRAAQPTVPIIYVAITPTPARWQYWPSIQEANRLVAEAAASDPHIVVVDLSAQILDAAGLPRRDIYRRDGLHPNQAGYARWAATLRPVIHTALASSRRVSLH